MAGNGSGAVGVVLGGIAAVGAGIAAVVKFAAPAALVIAPIARSGDDVVRVGAELAHAAPGAEAVVGALGAGDDLARVASGLGDDAAGLSLQSRLRSLSANPGDDGALGGAADDAAAAGSADEGDDVISKSVDGATHAVDLGSSAGDVADLLGEEDRHESVLMSQEEYRAEMRRRVAALEKLMGEGAAVVVEEKAAPAN